MATRASLLLVLAVVLLIRLPFLNQAIQGDDIYYLLGAQHALIDPAHPSHARYIFQGEMVDMRGHPHPPLNSWILAGLLAVFGDVYEVPFHTIYTVFSLIAAGSMWFLAKRWVPDRPLGPALLFLATPAFVINGNSLESDLPFLAFWMAGITLFIYGRLAWAAVALILAAMTAYQAVVATPILWVYCWFHARRSKAAWAVAAVPVLTVAAYQVYERVTGGALPATVLAGYFHTYALQQLKNKLANAAALTAHTGWLVFPLAAVASFRQRWPVALAAAIGGALVDAHPLFWVSFAIGALVIAGCVTRKLSFLQAWVLIFFAAALVLFFAGSARYLLPIAAPLALLIGARPWAFAANLALGLALAFVNYQHWGQYRDFARAHATDAKRVWVNGEWGLRFYFESAGALPAARDQMLRPGDLLVTSDLGFPIPVTAPRQKVAEADIKPALPLRLIGLGSKSGYSTASLGFRPFDIATGPADRVRTEVILERNPVLSWLPMNAPEAESQVVSGIYQLEGTTRWMSGRAVLVLKPPPAPKPLEVQIYLPDAAPGRLVTVNGYTETVPGPGLHTVRTPPTESGTVTVTVDKTFSVPGDFRQLGAVLVGAGYR